MQKLIETLKSFGIEIPADKQADVKRHFLSITKMQGSTAKLFQN